MVGDNGRIDVDVVAAPREDLHTILKYIYGGVLPEKRLEGEAAVNLLFLSFFLFLSSYTVCPDDYSKL